MKNFILISLILVLFNNLNEILNISGDIDITKKAGHILEKLGLEEFSSRLLSCFVGHPVAWFVFEVLEFFKGTTPPTPVL